MSKRLMGADLPRREPGNVSLEDTSESEGLDFGEWSCQADCPICNKPTAADSPNIA
jgi:hypothetical protein